MSVDAGINRLLAAAADDWVGIWELVPMVTSVRDVSGPDDLRLLLEVVHQALDEGVVEVGDVTEKGFQPWGVSPSEASQRIEREWRRFPKGPRLGDMSCWFNLTGKGQERINQESQ